MMKNILAISTFFICTSVCLAQGVSQKIVLVDVSKFDKGEIAKLISLLNSKFSPSVISINILFKSNEPHDSELIEALTKVENIVIASRLENLFGLSLGIRQPEFYPQNSKSGFSSPLLEDNVLMGIQKFYISYEDKSKLHFAVITAMVHDSIKTAKFIKKHTSPVIIDYKKGRRSFTTLNAKEILGGKIKHEVINGKILIIGQISSEDNFVIPVYKRDHEIKMRMSSSEIIANIIAQILE